MNQFLLQGKELDQFKPTKEQALKILEELGKRQKQKVDIIDKDFEKQAAFVEDDGGLIAALCTRRAGKSYGCGLKLCRAALSYPGTSQLYIALTRIQAKAIMIKDVLRVIDRKFSLGAQFNMTELSVTFPNGSMIYLMGMDSSDEEKDKALGQKYKQVIIDEAGSFRRDLREIVYAVLKPACADLRGQICIIGTPQSLTSGLFYDVVESRTESGWHLHRWTAFDNPYIVDQWEKEIEELKKANPRVIETPWFRQNYLGEYVVDQTKLVYRFDRSRNVLSSKDIPLLRNYVLGIDLGYTDATAFSVLGYEDQTKKLYVVETYKESELTITDTARWIKHFEKKYNPYKMVIDNANKQAVEEMKKRFNLPLYPADKSGKADFIEIMNSEFIMSNIMVSEASESLISEYENLIWDDKADKKVEHPNCDNHLADATLYAWRYCYQYSNTTQVKKKTFEEKEEAWLEREFELMDAKKNKEWWDK